MQPLDRDRAINIFNLFCGLGYAVSVKHIRGNYYVEVPVRLKGDKAYRQEVKIVEIATRAGFAVMQTGQTLRIA